MSGANGFGRRAAGHVAWRVRRATTATLDRMRSGDRTVITTPSAGLRFGNWLYLWLDAHQRTAAGERTVVLEVPGMEPWLTEFPSLRGLTVEPDLVRFHDRREWNDESWTQRFGVDFTRQTLDAFIRDIIAPYIPVDTSGRLVVNVRRGDYYSNPGLRERYGFDVDAYLAAALEIAGPSESVLVVSDDPEWCAENLGSMLAEHSDVVDYAPRGAEGNFRAVCGASRLIGTNSTFSYWGGYVAGVLHPSPVVIMPRFHARLVDSVEARQLDPSWTALDGFH